jgi:hypothetical protein
VPSTVVVDERSQGGRLIAQVRFGENDKTHASRVEALSLGAERGFVRGVDDDEEAAGWCAESRTGFVCRVARLGYLEANGKVRADGDVQPGRTGGFRLPGCSWP